MPTLATITLILLSALLAGALVVRPAITANTSGKILAFVGLFFLPLFCLMAGMDNEMERSKSTAFCLSCHIMEPYGRSLYVDDASYIPAAHFQNHRVPADKACYTCHTNYAMFGTINAKMEGLHHVYVYWFGKPMNPIKLYSPYNNRECLHCHSGARNFEESATHSAMMSDLKANTLSCTTSGCHDTFHPIDKLGEVKFWKPTQ